MQVLVFNALGFWKLLISPFWKSKASKTAEDRDILPFMWNSGEFRGVHLSYPDTYSTQLLQVISCLAWANGRVKYPEACALAKKQSWTRSPSPSPQNRQSFITLKRRDRKRKEGKVLREILKWLSSFSEEIQFKPEITKLFWLKRIQFCTIK